MNCGMNLGWKYNQLGSHTFNKSLTYVMREVGVHDNYKVARAEIQPMYVCGPIRNNQSNAFQLFYWLTPVQVSQRVAEATVDTLYSKDATRTA